MSITPIVRSPRAKPFLMVQQGGKRVLWGETPEGITTIEEEPSTSERALILIVSPRMPLDYIRQLADEMSGRPRKELVSTEELRRMENDFREQMEEYARLAKRNPSWQRVARNRRESIAKDWGYPALLPERRKAI